MRGLAGIGAWLGMRFHRFRGVSRRVGNVLGLVGRRGLDGLVLGSQLVLQDDVEVVEPAQAALEVVEI